jgi:membrane protease YdiL (CAAX protease family)
MSQTRRSNASLVRRLTSRWPVATFSAIVLGLAGLVMLAGLDAEATPFALVLVIPLSATLTAALVGGRSMVRGLFARIVRWRVPARWYLAAIGIPLAAALMIDVAGLVAGEADLETLVGALTPNALLVPLVVFLPALFEEFAWRGFAVEVMVERGSGFAKAALGVGLVFTAIHLPLYLPGQLFDHLPIWPGVLFLLGAAVLLTWIYLGSGRSSLLAGICHAALNGTVPLRWGLDEVWEWQVRGILIGMIGLVILVLVRNGPVGPVRPANLDN